MRTWTALALLAALAGCGRAYEAAPGYARDYDIQIATAAPALDPDLPPAIDLPGNPATVKREGQEFLIIEEPVRVSPGRLIMGRPPDPVRREIRLPKGGELRTRIADRDVVLPLKHTDVKAEVAGFVGSVNVTQQYHNPYAEKIEAVYVFPLPDDAAVRDFVLQIGERQIRGVVREREEAQRIYLEARRQGHVASLLTQERPNLFTQAVANLEPGKRIDVRISYLHTLRYADETFEFVFPMVVGPRYNPPGTRDGVGAVPAGAAGASGQKTELQYLRPEEISAHDVAVEVAIDAGLPIEDPASPSHVVRVERASPQRARVTLSPNDRIPNKDFVLRWKVAGKGVRPALATHRAEDATYVALMLHPPAKLAEVPRRPREMIFVLDCSGSMSGEPLAAAKRSLEKCLQRLSPDDTFQIIRFSDRASAMGAAPVAATPDNVRLGLRHLESLTSEGGTEMLTGIQAALDAPAAPGRHRIVSFMTDGYIGNEREILGEVRRRLGRARIFSFGVGTSVNRHLIEGLARVGRGVSAYVLQGDASERAANELYERIERPALTDLEIDGLAEAHPSPLPDLHVGRPVVVVGRLKGDGPIRLRGRIGGEAWETSIEAKAGAAHPALGSVWARGRIASLHDAMNDSADPMELAQEIRRVALRHGLMSEWTAFVAVDSLSRTEGTHGTTVVQPVPVPKGVRYETTVEKK
jgi:Ca-activated chloride channel family protein